MINIDREKIENNNLEDCKSKNSIGDKQVFHKQYKEKFRKEGMCISKEEGELKL